MHGYYTLAEAVEASGKTASELHMLCFQNKIREVRYHQHDEPRYYKDEIDALAPQEDFMNYDIIYDSLKRPFRSSLTSNPDEEIDDLLEPSNDFCPNTSSDLMDHEIATITANMRTLLKDAAKKLEDANNLAQKLRNAGCNVTMGSNDVAVSRKVQF